MKILICSGTVVIDRLRYRLMDRLWHSMCYGTVVINRPRHRPGTCFGKVVINRLWHSGHKQALAQWS